HVRQGDFLDPPPFPLHDHHVVDADGLGQGDLDARQQGADALLGARPITMPAMPAEAKRLSPTWRTPGMVMSIEAKARTAITARAIFSSTATWVCTRRARRLSGAVTS